MRSTAFAAVLLWWANPEAIAGEIQQASVDFVRGTYTVEIDGLVSAVSSEVYRLVTDHDQLYLLNNIVLESRLLTRPGDPVQMRRVVLHVCILFFCRNMKLVESLQDNGSEELIATVVPAASDFKTGRTVWRVTPAGTAQSHFQMQSTFRPGFWVPPVIGPLLIRKKMEHELSVMMTRLEQYAGTVHGH